MKKVFISSTCFDLIDLRAEIETQLREMGLTPVMSDRPSMEFKIIPDANSIETCLTNVRNSDVFLIIISQRYGPSLLKSGYPDISATHLEYKEAKKAGKPIYMYVRDRLESDFVIWKRNKPNPIELSWVKKGDENIFKLMEEHRILVNKSSASNWFWIYRDSIELKQRLMQDLQKESGKAILKNLIDSNRVAHLIPQISSWYVNEIKGELKFEVTTINAGTSAAIHPFITISNEENEEPVSIHSILPGEKINTTILLDISKKLAKKRNPTFTIDFSYATAEGHYVGDEFYLELSWEEGENTGWEAISYQNKRYYHSNGFTLKVRDEN